MDGVAKVTEPIKLPAGFALVPDLEMDLLREFYRSWVAFHKIPRDPLHRKKQEAASQLMVTNAHAVAAFYQTHEYRAIGG